MHSLPAPTVINGTVGIDDCDHELHAGATEDASGTANKKDKVKEEALLLELQEKLHSQEQNLLIQEIRTPIWSLLQEENERKLKGIQTMVRVDS